MRYQKAKQLQNPDDVDPAYLKGLLDARLDSLRYKKSRRGHDLSGDLEMIYSQCIRSIQLINLLIESPLHDLDSLAEAVGELRVRLNDTKFHVRSSSGPLLHLEKHIDALGDDRHN